MTSNCPNCGGPYDVGAVACPYCGTLNPDFTSVMYGKPINVSFTHAGVEHTFKFLISTISADYSAGETLYADNQPVMTLMGSMDVEVRGHVLPMRVDVNGEEREVLHIARETKGAL